MMVGAGKVSLVVARGILYRSDGLMQATGFSDTYLTVILINIKDTDLCTLTPLISGTSKGDFRGRPPWLSTVYGRGLGVNHPW